jgi:DNA-binding winged helix-turn-helix (wHTH) protein
LRSRFDRFTVDSATRQLLGDGHEIHLSRKAFDVLCVLIVRRPEVVTKEELFRKVWPDTFVTEANLNVLVREIRRALGDNAHTPRFVRTAHGVGYAFSAEAVDLDLPARPGGEAPRAWLVGPRRTYELSEGSNLIGRDPQCGIWLDDTGVSRRHARVRWSGTDTTVVLEDLESTNGTFVGAHQVTSATPLSHGDKITIGPVELELRVAPNEQPPTKRIRRRSGE